MRSRSSFVLLVLVSFAAAGALAASQQNPVTPYVGDWVGTGWGTEVRFKQTRGEFVRQMAGGRAIPGATGEETIMSLTVKHATNFVVTVAADGSISGEGHIVYDLFPNLCGVAALTKQVNEAVDRMELMPKVFKLATEVGARSVEQFHASWYAEEAKLARKVNEIETAVREYEKMGGAGKAAGSAAMNKVTTSMLLKSGEPADVRALVSAVVFGRCTNPAYKIAGSSTPCLDLFVRPMAKDIPGAGEGTLEILLDQALDRLNDTVKEKVQALNGRAEREAAACAAAPNALRAGTAVGPETLAELAVHMAGVGANAAGDMATGGVPEGLMLSIPGVTQVQYSYKGLSKGAEARRFKIKGRLEPVADGTAKMHLEMDGDVTGGDKNLYVEYMVNYKRDRRPFPTWSPFLAKDGTARRSGIERVLERQKTKDGREVSTATDIVRGAPFVTFHDSGVQRNGVKVWHDYEYYWQAHKIVEPR